MRLKLIVEGPIEIEADVESCSNQLEAAMGVDKTDFVKLSNMTASEITVPVTAVRSLAVISE